MAISTSISRALDKSIDRFGTRIMLCSGTRSFNARGDETVTWSTGSYYNGALSNLTVEEIQFLPEGERSDTLMKLLVRTDTPIDLSYKVNISGATEEFDVLTLRDQKLIQDKIIYKQAIIRKK